MTTNHASQHTHRSCDALVRLDGERWVEAVFPYQSKCLDVLRQARLALQPEVRQTLDALVEGSGCEGLFAQI